MRRSKRTRFVWLLCFLIGAHREEGDHGTKKLRMMVAQILLFDSKRIHDAFTWGDIITIWKSKKIKQTGDIYLKSVHFANFRNGESLSPQVHASSFFCVNDKMQLVSSVREPSCLMGCYEDDWGSVGSVRSARSQGCQRAKSLRSDFRPTKLRAVAACPARAAGNIPLCEGNQFSL